MSLWELVAVAGTMASVLGVFLTIYVFLNNRTLKQESKATRDLIIRMDAGHSEILSRIDQGQEETRKEVAEARKETAEARKEMAEARREMAEAIKYLADLIRMEGERTRQAVRAPS
ncbi:MAG: hypothetical protein HYS38_05895 [Acidobacteria bacterium]|nr:hypothetical protein [Acidobacteriota bacterium]